MQLNVMKYKYLISSLAMMAMGLVGCSDDEIMVTSLPEVSGSQEIRIYASTGSATRLGITDDATRIKFTWDETDKFVIFNGSQATEFVIDPKSIDPTGAYFVGTPATPYKKGETLYAVYDKNANASNDYSRDKDGNVNINLAGQNGSLSDQYNYLFGQTIFSSSDSLNFVFDNVVTMLKVSIDLPEDVTSVDSIKLVNGNYKSSYNLRSSATMVLSKPVVSPNGNIHEIGSLITADNGFWRSSETITVKPASMNKNTAVAYFYVLPTQLINWGGNYEAEPDYEPDFVLYSGNREFVAVKDYGVRRVKGGRTYAMNTPAYEIESFENESSVSDWNTTYQIANSRQMYSLMLRIKANLKDAMGRYYSECNYSLLNSVELMEDIEWTPMYLSSASFDGNGNTIAGKLYMDSDRNDVYTQEYFYGRIVYDHAGLFGQIDQCKIKNIKMSADVLISGTYWIPNAGLICGSADNSTIEYCSTSGSLINPNTVYTGGIAGHIWSSNIIGCSSTGVLGHNSRNWYHGNEIQMGGIVGECYGNSQIKACYSTAKINAEVIGDTPVSYHAGIVGHAHQYDWGYGMKNLEIVGCWSRVPMEIGEVSTDHILYFGGISGYNEYGVIKNCYWSDDLATYPTCDTNCTVTGCESFVGNAPTPAQLTAANNALLGSGYAFNMDGTITKDNKSTIDPFETEKW